jgi:hypothetical protein
MLEYLLMLDGRIVDIDTDSVDLDRMYRFIYSNQNFALCITGFQLTAAAKS